MCHQQPISHLPVWVLERRGITDTELRRVRARASSDGAGSLPGEPPQLARLGIGTVALRSGPGRCRCSSDVAR